LALFVHDGEHDTVLLLHGGPGVPDYLEPVARMLAPRHRAARFDQRGVGKSIALSAAYGIGDYLADVDAVRNHLRVERLHLFGHSWGGLLAQLYASAYPDQTASLVLCNSSTGAGPGLETHGSGRDGLQPPPGRRCWVGGHGAAVVYGTETETLFARFPSATHVRLERSGHLPWLQDKQAFGQALEEFYGSIT
jgi:pimeloyl-ACP methyl ester carboxylesterase